MKHKLTKLYELRIPYSSSCFQEDDDGSIRPLVAWVDYNYLSRESAQLGLKLFLEKHIDDIDCHHFFDNTFYNSTNESLDSEFKVINRRIDQINDDGAMISGDVYGKSITTVKRLTIMHEGKEYYHDEPISPSDEFVFICRSTLPLPIEEVAVVLCEFLWD